MKERKFMARQLVKVKGGTEKNVDTAFKKATTICIVRLISQVVIFLASGVAIFLSTMMGYWGITLCAAFLCYLATFKILEK